MAKRALPRQTCTDHCGGCNQHFHGLGAFTAHRQAMRCTPGADVTFAQGKKKGQLALQAWTENGYCSLQTGCRAEGKVIKWLNPVTIWQTAGEKWQGPDGK